MVALEHRPTRELPDHLRVLYGRFPFERSIAQDPLSCVRPYRGDRKAAEIAGLFAATLAIGTTTSIRHSFERFMQLGDGDPVALVDHATGTRVPAAMRRFRHRWIRGDQLYALARTLNDLYTRYPSVEDLFLEGYRENGFATGLDRMARGLRDGPAGRWAVRPGPRGYGALFPSPLDRSHSPCKRLTLFVRWMVRTEFPDLGLWTQVLPLDLRVPLDLHVHWIAYHLGMTQRRTRNWTTVEEVTSFLRGIDPVDSVRFDFVLCHTGISGDCPKERDLAVCGPCVVRPDCLLWRDARPVVAA